MQLEMQMCFLGFKSRAKAWTQRKERMKHRRAFAFAAEAHATHWRDLAAFAKERFNLCIQDVVSPGLRTI